MAIKWIVLIALILIDIIWTYRLVIAGIYSKRITNIEYHLNYALSAIIGAYFAVALLIL